MIINLYKLGVEGNLCRWQFSSPSELTQALVTTLITELGSHSFAAAVARWKNSASQRLMFEYYYRSFDSFTGDRTHSYPLQKDCFMPEAPDEHSGCSPGFQCCVEDEATILAFIRDYVSTNGLRLALQENDSHSTRVEDRQNFVTC